MTTYRRPAAKPFRRAQRRTRRDQIAGPSDIGKRAESDLLPRGAWSALHPRGLRPPVRQYADRCLPKAQSNAKVPTMIDGDLVIWESHTILRYLAAVHGPTLTGATPAERTMVDGWRVWLLGARNTPYVAVFKDAKKAPAERAPDFAAQAADLVAQLKILDGHIAG